MKRRTLISMILLVTVVCLLAAPACITNPSEEEKEKVNQPSEPPDQPPPPPPPPPAASPDPSPIPTLEEIAGNVLRGAYGPELEQLLTDEVATCLNMMVEAGMISATRSPDGIELERIETENSEILYSDRYLIEWILDGRYGETARSNLLAFIRSIESK